MRRGHALLFAAAATTLVGCVEPRRPPLRVAVYPWLGFATLVLARETSLLGPAVQVVEYRSILDSLRALRNGAVDAAALSLGEVLALLDDGVAVKIALVLDRSRGADAVIGRAGISVLAELGGRRVGVEATSAGAHLLLHAARSAGLPRGELVFVHLPFHDHEAALLAGEVDAVVTFEPARTRLERHGARVLFDSLAMPGGLLDVIAMRPWALEEDLAAARTLARGVLAAVELARHRPEVAAPSMGEHAGIAPGELVAALQRIELVDAEENRRLLDAEAAPLERAAAALAAELFAEGMLASEVDTRGLADARALPERR